MCLVRGKDLLLTLFTPQILSPRYNHTTLFLSTLASTSLVGASLHLNTPSGALCLSSGLLHHCLQIIFQLQRAGCLPLPPQESPQALAAQKQGNFRLLCRLYSPTLKPYPTQAWPHPCPAFGRLFPLPRGAFFSDFRLEVHRVQLSRSRRRFPETSAFHPSPSHAPSGIPVSIPALLELSGRCLSTHCLFLVKQS